MVVAVIPAYNEDSVLKTVITSVRPFVDRIIVVNDGSIDNTREVASQANVDIVSHAFNRGLGAALKTGFMVALEMNAEWIITIDADGQLIADDIPKMLEFARARNVQAVLGSRMGFMQETMPWIRYLYLTIANVVTWLLFGTWSNDSQSGLRAFHHSALRVMNLQCDHMAISSEILAELGRKHISWAEFPIHVLYTPYSLAKAKQAGSKSQNFLRGIETAWKLFLRRFSE